MQILSKNSNLFLVTTNDFIYKVFFLYLLCSIVIVLVLIFLSVALGYNFFKKEFDLGTAYECGFIPFERVHVQFEIKFFLIAILFVLFDLEVVFLIPWAVSFHFFSLYQFLMMLVFVGILSISFLYEIFSRTLLFNLTSIKK
jgi:NADH-quinone oxidoreductase subunit A